MAGKRDGGLDSSRMHFFFFLVICYYYTNKKKKETTSTPHYNTIRPPHHNQGHHYYHDRTTDGTGNKCRPYDKEHQKKNQETSSSTSPGHRSVVLLFSCSFFYSSFILGKAATSSPQLPLHQHQDCTARGWAQG